MGRPEGITEERIAKWHETYLKRDESICLRSFEEEYWYSGEWLGEELYKLNCPSDLSERISFAVGQRQAAVSDPWPVAVKALEEYKQGRWEEPGEALAKKIFHEQFGDNPNPMQILAWMLNKGFDLEKAKAEFESGGTLPEVPPNVRN
jgi:hypothetical protein